MGFYKQTLNKYERLKSTRAISILFSAGSKHFEYPLLLKWKEHQLPCDYPAQLLVSVSKKRFKKAPDRNRIKRLLREGYRKNKHLIYPFLEENDKQLMIAITFVGKKIPTHKEIEDKIIILLQRLSQEYEDRQEHHN